MLPKRGRHPRPPSLLLLWGFILLLLSKAWRGDSSCSVLGLGRGGGGAPSSRWCEEEGGWEPALARSSWQDGDGHGSGSSDFISTEAGGRASRSLNAARATGGEGATPDLPSHNTAFLPAPRAGGSRAARSTLPAGHIPGLGSGLLLLSTQKPVSSSIRTGNFLVPPLLARCFGKELRGGPCSITSCPTARSGVQTPPRTGQISRCSKPVERSRLVKGRAGQDREPRAARAAPGSASGLAAAPGRDPGPVRSHWLELLGVGVAPASAPSRGSSRNLCGRDG